MKARKSAFSADGFGKFGALDTDEDWACEARRYYFNICGKYGVQVQALLKKQLSLTLRKSVRYTVLFLLKISVIILTFMTSGASMSRRLTVYLSLIVQFMAIPKKPL